MIHRAIILDPAYANGNCTDIGTQIKKFASIMVSSSPTQYQIKLWFVQVYIICKLLLVVPYIAH
jgi:hypothetical protein